MVQVIDTVAHWQQQLAELRARNPQLRVGFVPTMGALHEGHLALARRARELTDVVVVSIFVNPTQFGPGEDFDRYPRTLEADVAALEGLADVVFAPAVEEVYPDRAGGEPVEQLTAGAVGESFEGASRSGHFDGVLTVVARLFDIVQPQVAVFGQKDAQQVFLVRRLVAQRYPHLTLEVLPTVRESDGLARSSRNRYLTPEQRAEATVMPRALAAMRVGATAGAAAAREAGLAVFAAQPDTQLSYAELVDPATFTPVPDGFHGQATAILAARVGTTRLLDTDEVWVD